MKNHVLPLVLIALFCAVGCGRKKTPEEPPAPEPDADQLVDALYDRLDEMDERGATNEMIRALGEALEDGQLADQHVGILRRLLELQTGVGDVESAKELYLSVLDRDQSLGAQAFGVIESHLLGKEQTQDLIAWGQLLLDNPSAASLHVHVHGLIMDALVSSQDWETLFAAFDNAVRDLPEDQGSRLVSRTLAALLMAEQREPLAEALDYISVRHATRPAYARVITMTRIRLALRESNVKKAAELVSANADLLTDVDLSRGVEWTVRAATAADQVDVAEGLCDSVVTKRPPDSRAVASAGRHWVVLAKDAGKLDEAQRRLAVLRARGLPVRSLLSLTSEIIYVIMDHGSDAARLSLLDTCLALRELAESESDGLRAATLTLDACFMTESFDEALQVLEGGVPKKDENWHRTLTIKVRAHKALKEDRIEDAIGHFRSFVDFIRESDEPLVDPSTGATVPLDSILGLNAVRIGDLWKSIDKLDNARAAYDEARAHYAKALEEVDAGSKEHRDIRKSLEAVPVLKDG